jgi:hypothetical protein
MTTPRIERDFNEDLEWSHAQAKLPLWEETYKKAFPDFNQMTYVADDGWAQRGGIDRIVTTTGGRVWQIDEKSRRDYWPVSLPHRKYFKPHVTVFPDIALEFMDNDKRKTPGWIEKPMACDYLAYNILPLRQVYLLPMAQAQAVWRRYKLEWLEQFHWKESQNRGYKTLFCPVPVPVLMRAVCEAMFFKHSWLDEYEQHIKREAGVPADQLPSSLDTLFEL